VDQKRIEFTCEKCRTKQVKVVILQPLPLSNPAANDPSKATVHCEKCGHRQTVSAKG
jgi:DNA-directed RNA polymerase subunit M/transcription elongation factor TFIIS